VLKLIIKLPDKQNIFQKFVHTKCDTIKIVEGKKKKTIRNLDQKFGQKRLTQVS
jgi:hypothetical protein